MLLERIRGAAPLLRRMYAVLTIFGVGLAAMVFGALILKHVRTGQEWDVRQLVEVTLALIVVYVTMCVTFTIQAIMRNTGGGTIGASKT